MQGLGGLILGSCKRTKGPGVFLQGGGGTATLRYSYGCRFGFRRSGTGPEGSILDGTCPALGFPRARPVQGARAGQEFPVSGDSTGAALR